MLLADNTLLADRYRVLRLLWQCGIGASYLAADIRFRNAAVVVRQTLVVSDRDDFREAFQREAMLLNTLRHPALPRVMDSFGYRDSEFVVAEYIAGDDLATQLVRRGTPFPVEIVALWADRLLDALSYLHSRVPPVIHRHVEPRNVMLTPEGEVVLLGLGFSDGSAVAQATVGPSEAVGAGNYAPPELANGREADGRADLYSLAATVRYLLTMESPADASRRMVCSVNGDADPILPVHLLNPAVAPVVSDVLGRAMSLRADDRPESAAAMRDALRVGFGELARGFSQMKPYGLGGSGGVPVKADAPATGAWPPPARLGNPSSATVVEKPWPQHPRTDVWPKAPATGRGAASREPGSRGGSTNATLWVAGVWLAFIVAIGVFAVWYLTKLNEPPEPLPPFVPIAVSPVLPPPPKNISVDIGTGVSVELVLIPAGTFTMGAVNEASQKAPLHQVTISRPFYMGKFEVTLEQWERLMGSRSSLPPEIAARSPKDPAAGRHPVKNVSWDEVQEFIGHLNEQKGGGWRLPTEAEWEYACRAGTTEDSTVDFDQREWYVENSENMSHPVGEKRPNAWGLHDMQGNVAEWCQDFYSPRGHERVIRGGAYAGDPCPSSGRRSYVQHRPEPYTGFRLVKVL